MKTGLLVRPCGGALNVTLFLVILTESLAGGSPGNKQLRALGPPPGPNTARILITGFAIVQTDSQKLTATFPKLKDVFDCQPKPKRIPDHLPKWRDVAFPKTWHFLSPGPISLTLSGPSDFVPDPTLKQVRTYAGVFDDHPDPGNYPQSAILRITRGTARVDSSDLWNGTISGCKPSPCKDPTAIAISVDIQNVPEMHVGSDPVDCKRGCTIEFTNTPSDHPVGDGRHFHLYALLLKSKPAQCPDTAIHAGGNKHILNDVPPRCIPPMMF